MKKILISTALLIIAGIFFVSCKKANDVNNSIVQAPSILIATTADPYSGPQPIGGAAYYLVQKKITDNNQASLDNIYTNRRNGQPYSDAGKVYYNPLSTETGIEFGSAATGNVIDFRNNVNQRIDQQGYAIISGFFSGGPMYTSWNMIN